MVQGSKLINRLIARPPLLYRLLFPETTWRIQQRGGGKTVYLTFDDGPVPEVTPQVLEILDNHGIKATFFMVGDNVRKYPWLKDEVLRRGHGIGNHTMHHLQGRLSSTRRYVADIQQAASLIPSVLFRPPHGLMRWKQSRIVKNHYNVVMYDLVSRDYARNISGEQVLDNVMRYVRNGSIIVFHDSLKARDRMLYALPRVIEGLKNQGYEFRALQG